MKKEVVILVYFITGFLMSCSSPPPSDPKLKEAYAIHQKYLSIGDESMKMLKSVQAEDEKRQELESQIMDWGANIIEVPGFPCSKDREFYEHSHNGPELALTPEEMLEVQKELLDSLQAIRLRIEALH